MPSISSFAPAFLFFFLPLAVAFTLTFAGTKIFFRKIGRARLPLVTGMSTFAIANLAFMAMNTQVTISPLGAENTWLHLWTFGFLPISIIFAIVLTTFVDHLHENDDEKHL